MIYEAYMPVYRCPDFHCVRTGSPEVVQEALADLKRELTSRVEQVWSRKPVGPSGGSEGLSGSKSHSW